MNWWELKWYLENTELSTRKRRQYEVQLHLKMAFPFACMVFALLGTPLALQSQRRTSLGGFRNHPFECDLLLCFNGCGDFSRTIGTDLALGWRLAPKSAHWWLRFISLYTKSVQHLAEGEQSVRYYFWF